MSFKEKYKKDNENIKPREETLIKLGAYMNKGKKIQPKSKFNYRLIAGSIAALLILSGMIFNKGRFSRNYNLVNNDIIDDSKNNEVVEKDNEIIKEGLEVPKEEIAKMDPNIEASRVPTLVYKGKVYLEAGTKITLEEGKALMDKKIGVTYSLFNYIEDDGTSVGYVDLEKLEDFAGPSEGDDVYTVKGYDDDFRLITYTKNNGVEYLELWECLNGMILSKGEDVFGLMKIKSNINNLKWDTFNNWNYGTPDPKEVNINETLDKFIDAVYDSIPFSLEDREFRNQFFYNEVEYYSEGEEKQKFLYLKLNDGTEIDMRLFSNGYVLYSAMPGFVFKVDDTIFNSMWDYLE